jgi:putative glutamine amidotransferase
MGQPRCPVIGITCYVESIDRPPWVSQPSAVLPRMYLEHVARAGGIPVILPPGDEHLTDAEADARAREVLDRVDGLIIAGGADVQASRYAALPHPTSQAPRPDRDAWELALARVSAETGIPILGVCRGMQIMAVANGGTLDQHLPDTVGTDVHLQTAGVFTRHTVRVADGSHLAGVLGAETVEVPTYHHQGVATHPGYAATAWTADGVVEAFEDPQARFRLAVQWHPEAAEDSSLFRSLVAAATTWSASRDTLSGSGPE